MLCDSPNSNKTVKYLGFSSLSTLIDNTYLQKKLAKVDDQTFPQNIFLIFKACHYPEISVPTSQGKKTSTYHHIFHHQAGRDEEKLVIWDYHVIALYRPEEVSHHHHHCHHHLRHHHFHHHGQYMKTHV